MNLLRRAKRVTQSRLALVLTVVVIIAIAETVAIVVTGGFQDQVTTPSTLGDSASFLQGNVQRVAGLRVWFMSPFNSNASKAGYDSTYGMIRGGFWSGAFQNGFVLIDSQLIAGKSLDYFNAAAGMNTSIEANLRQWLAGWFIDQANSTQLSYDGNDRREIMFGKVLPCVMGDSGQIFYAPGHLPTDAVPVTTALPTTCISDAPSGMNTYSLWIELYDLQGNLQKAESMFAATIGGWTPTPGTGLGGATGGYFSDIFDSGPMQGKCKSSRTLGYWLEMARATGFWNLNDQSRQTAAEVMAELWAHQAPDGGISVTYPGCGGDLKESPESTGLALVAFDPRVPSWFGHPEAGQTSTSQTQADISPLLHFSVIQAERDHPVKEVRV